MPSNLLHPTNEELFNETIIKSNLHHKYFPYHKRMIYHSLGIPKSNCYVEILFESTLETQNHLVSSNEQSYNLLDILSDCPDLLKLKYYHNVGVSFVFVITWLTETGNPWPHFNCEFAFIFFEIRVTFTTTPFIFNGKLGSGLFGV